MNNEIKTEGIPVWVTYFLTLILLFGIGTGAPALFVDGFMEGHAISQSSFRAAVNLDSQGGGRDG